MDSPIDSAFLRLWGRAVRVLPKGRHKAFQIGWIMAGRPHSFVGEIDGMPFVVDAQDKHTAMHMYLWGTYEPEFSFVFKSMIRPGMTVLDVGANKGFFSLLAAKSLLPSGKVISYEPLPRNFKDLAETARLSGLSSWLCRNVAVSNCVGKALLTSSSFEAGHSGWASVSEKGTHPVQTVTLDAEIESLDITRVDVMKMDIEGHEYEAVCGMKKCLSQHVIRSVFIEIHESTVSRSKTLEIVSAFKENGYCGYFISEGKEKAARALNLLKSNSRDAAFLLQAFDVGHIDHFKTADSRFHVLWTLDELSYDLQT